MTADSMTYSISKESLTCRSVIPSARSTSSRDLGWTSLLVDLHVGLKSNEPYTSIRTPDARIGVSISGRYSCEFFSRSRWRFDAHSPGSICLHRNDYQSRYRFPVPQDGDFKWAMIYLPVGQLASAAEHLRRAGQPYLLPTFNSLVDRDPAIAHITVALLRAMANGDSNLYAETVAAWLAVHLISRHGPSGSSIEDRSAGAISDARLRRVVEFMSAHFAQPLTLEQLAGEACISKYHFTRLFKTKVGQTPYQFLADLRLNAARQMLISTDLSVAQVGAACGYSTSSHFSAAFAAKFSMTPSEFRGSRLGLTEIDNRPADCSANH